MAHNLGDSMNPFQELADTAIPKSIVQKFAGLCIATSTRAGMRTMCRQMDSMLGGRHNSFQQLESELPDDIKHFQLVDHAIAYISTIPARTTWETAWLADA